MMTYIWWGVAVVAAVGVGLVFRALHNYTTKRMDAWQAEMLAHTDEVLKKHREEALRLVDENRPRVFGNYRG